MKLRVGQVRQCLLPGPIISQVARVPARFPFLSLAALMVVLCSPSVAQKGQNAVYNHAMTPAPTNSPSFFDATQFGTGGDACQQIAATFTDSTFPSTGGTVDARGLVSGVNTTLTCSVNPIPSGKTGRLLLSAGTYLAQVPWVIQNNDINIIGTGASDNSGNNNTIVQACASGQTGCGGVVFPSGQGVIQMGTSSTTVYRSTVKELAVDCQGVPGVSGFQVIAAEEETVFDLVRAQGCPVAGIDIGVGDANVENGAALSNFEVNYTNGVGCPAVASGTMSSATRTGNVVTAIVSSAPTPNLFPGNEVVITGWSNPNFNGTYRLSSVALPTIKYMTSATGGSTTGTGSISPYPVGVRVWQESSPRYEE
jgi:hypothetical protein